MSKRCGWTVLLALTLYGSISGQAAVAPAMQSDGAASAPDAQAGALAKPAQSKPAALLCQSSADDAADDAARAALVAKLTRAAPSMTQVRIASPLLFMPDSGPVQLLVFRQFADKDETGGSAQKLNYRIFVLDAATSGAQQPTTYHLIDTAQISAEAATTGTHGSDFMTDETTSPKTLLRFDSQMTARADEDRFGLSIWRKARVVVIACARANGDSPQFYGTLDTSVARSSRCRLIAILICLAFYCAVAVATFHIHKAQRMFKSDEEIVLNHASAGGTNYASWLRHFDPVVLSADSQGRGSATKLQILFFSVLVFGVVSYIWMLTGHLTGLSSNVLLLMGISGVGATASAGTELTLNRLHFNNWAWLINRHWLPKGGVAEVNFAHWKDIVTTDGEFDVYRFQMITFSFLVGMAILGAGTQLTDLSTFEIPSALLGILGMSQVVYVIGKLVAPPSIADLNKQIDTLRLAEKSLRDTLEHSVAALLDKAQVRWKDDDKLSAAKIAYKDYVLQWETTRTMFEATLGRMVPKHAEDLRPPYSVPGQVARDDDGRLRDATAKRAYDAPLLATGGAAPYLWKVVQSGLPRGLTLGRDGHLSGTPDVAGTYHFTLTVSDANNTSRTKDFTLQVLPA